MGKGVKEYKIDTGVRSVKINDETISINMQDQGIVGRFIDLMETFNGIEAEITERGKPIDGMPDNTTEEQIAKAKASDVLNMEIHEKIKGKVEGVTGAGSVSRVFGCDVPSIFSYVEFLNAINGLFEEYNKERAAKMSKYSPGRTGNT